MRAGEGYRFRGSVVGLPSSRGARDLALLELTDAGRFEKTLTIAKAFFLADALEAGAKSPGGLTVPAKLGRRVDVSPASKV